MPVLQLDGLGLREGTVRTGSDRSGDSDKSDDSDGFGRGRTGQAGSMAG